MAGHWPIARALNGLHHSIYEAKTPTGHRSPHPGGAAERRIG
jgi:hypothetical protein